MTLLPQLPRLIVIVTVVVAAKPAVAGLAPATVKVPHVVAGMVVVVVGGSVVVVEVVVVVTVDAPTETVPEVTTTDSRRSRAEPGRVAPRYRATTMSRFALCVPATPARSTHVTYR